MKGLADLLATRADALVLRWTELVADGLATGARSEPELRDHVPEILGELTSALRRGRTPATSETAEQHARQRFRLGFDVEEVVREYDLLRGVILDCAEEADLALTLAEVRVFVDFIASSIAHGVAEHGRQRDHGERSLAQELRSSEERLRRVVDASGTGIWELDLFSATVTADARQRALAGFPPHGPLALTDAIAATDPRDRERLQRALADAASGENHGRFLIELRTAGPSGAVRWLELRGQLSLDADGKRTRLLGTGVDITARKEAELGSAALLEALAGQPVFGVVLFRGPELVFATVNETYRQFVGNRDLAGKPLLEAVPELAGQGFDVLLERVLATGEPFIGREQAAMLDLRGDGTLEERFFNFVYQPVLGADGTARSVLVVTHDVTDAVRARRDAERLAAEAEERSGFEQQLIGIVSHDLRNPMNAILLGAGALLRGDDLSERHTKIAARIQSSAKRVGRMIRDLLDFTQARLSGAIRVERRAANLHEIIRGVVDEVEATHPGRRVRLSLQGEGRGEWDPDRIGQVLPNLITNALRYSREDSFVDVEARAEEERVVFSVHNEGPPIAAERMQGLFQPLQRGTEQVDGTSRSIGLGLYIVKQLVEAHGGAVAVTSTEREGTRFTVSLPRKARSALEG